MGSFFTKRRVVTLLIVAGAGILSGRLVPRAFLNLLLGGALFGGDIL